MRQAGIENDVHIYDDVNHGFWLHVDRDPERRLTPAADAWQRLKHISTAPCNERTECRSLAGLEFALIHLLGCRDKPFDTTAIETLAFKPVSQHAARLRLLVQRIRQLDFVISTRR